MKRDQKYRIIELGYGRECGWYLEDNQENVIADLVEPEWHEMFWDSYRIIPRYNYNETLNKNFWVNPELKKFRNRTFSEHVIESFGHYDEERDRVIIRSLYIPVGMNFFDKILCPIRYWKILMRHKNSSYRSIET